MESKNSYFVRSVIGLLLRTGILCTVFITSCSTRQVELDPELQKIVNYRFGESRKNLSAVADLVLASYGNTAEQIRIEKQFAQILRSDATLECKDFICRQLWIIGTKESVSELEKMLIDQKTSDMARYALETNPCPEAGKALRNVLGKVHGTVLIGIINSLGERRDEMSVKAIEKLMNDSDMEVALAAAAALKKN